MNRWAAIALFVLSTYTNACSCIPIDREKTYLLSDSVFSARITEQRVIKRDEAELVSSEFRSLT